ncbi:MAG TPA: LysE family translocator [Gammaproteobacteria bacterium]
MELLLPLVTFAFVASITPGPNNVMLSASGVAFGLQRTLPHLAGVSVGFLLLLVVCGSGVGAVLVEFPSAALALKAFGTVYLLYLGWRLRNALASRSGDVAARPLTFTEAVAFQFVNPKGWLMAVTAMSVFVPDWEPRWLAIGTVCSVFWIVNLPCVCTWAALGARLKHWLTDERRQRLLGGVLAVLTVYSVVAMWQ